MVGRKHTVAMAPGRRSEIALTLVVLAVPLCLSLWLLSMVGTVREHGSLEFALPWVPSLGVSLDFLVDGLSLLFALLISGIGVFVTLYAGSYLAGHALLRRFYLSLLLFMLGMLGLVLAGNLITLFVFWEVTTIASYLLIGFDHSSETARRAALQALLVTALGGLCLLAGLVLLGMVVGSYDLSTVLGQGEIVRSHGLYGPILILVLLGAFAKSAQVPLHFWLPNAMAAPTPVSAYLHSATMVKAGIYLIARLHPVLGYTDLWMWTLTLVGAGTAVIAAVLALRQTDLKLALAYTTVVALGTLTMFLGSEASVAIAAAMTFILVHSFYKAALFMVVGIIDHQAGTRELGSLGGLAARLPVTFIAALAAGLSMAGFPPFLGFIGKELKYEGALAIASEPLLVAGAAVFANALMVAVAATVVLKPFWGRLPAGLRSTREATPGLLAGPLLLAGLGLTFGLAPGLVAESLVQPAVTAVLGRPETVKLKLWHGINLPFFLSVVTLLLGTTIFLGQRWLRSVFDRLARLLPVSADHSWDRALALFRHLATVQTRFLQHGILRHYLAVVFASVAIVLLWVLAEGGVLSMGLSWPELTVKEWAALVLVLTGALFATTSRAPLAAICSLGALGVGIALIYLFFGAPDVAITQLLVETLFLVLVAMTLHRLPVLSGAHIAGFRPWDALLALLVGSAVSLTMLAVLEQPFTSPTRSFFEQAAVAQAYGRNIVNVILVDFRALDTFGEVLVVLVAAVGAASLLGQRLRGGKAAGGKRQP
ncbi:hydrogen gas-evolving membrane-bound hydrogenase subunit E [Microbulbifer zhoushanensis]|uniref:hydrogen gas-evolving membrane-bound hydrogenase subunit E n=1 Tax=Microbulbifer zhoushanensis TaxID=2904254 RepID=UPI001F3264C8|nr:hydrogen gas-evolving membrane-bound hydrogenase subunit E [Microbulbifer zhoushanensis]